MTRPQYMKGSNCKELFLKRKYKDMKDRVSGVGTKAPHLYEGKDIVDKDRFVSHYKSNNQFGRLFNNWVEAGFEKDLTPSPHREDNKIGYTFDNIEWVTWRDNYMEPIYKYLSKVYTITDMYGNEAGKVYFK